MIAVQTNRRKAMMLKGRNSEIWWRRRARFGELAIKKAQIGVRKSKKAWLPKQLHCQQTAGTSPSGSNLPMRCEVAHWQPVVTPTLPASFTFSAGAAAPSTAPSDYPEAIDRCRSTPVLPERQAVNVAFDSPRVIVILGFVEVHEQSAQLPSRVLSLFGEAFASCRTFLLNPYDLNTCTRLFWLVGQHHEPSSSDRKACHRGRSYHHVLPQEVS